MKATPDAGQTSPGGRYAVLGHPIAHSLSPRMHAANFAALGIEATYEAFDVDETGLAAALDDLQTRNYRGLNLTIPLKGRALELVGEATPLARLLGGVNTITFRTGGGRAGDNTDGHGFLASLRDAGLATVAGRRVLVLGCGGTGRALALTCAREGAAEILLANRTAARADGVAEAIRATFQRVAAKVLPPDPGAWSEASYTCNLIVHTTSRGLNPAEAPLLARAAFHPGQVLFDAVYASRRTAIMREAEQAGAQSLNGLGMLVHQGAQSFRIWTGLEPDLDAMRRAVGEIQPW